jgi:hypothetical protein
MAAVAEMAAILQGKEGIQVVMGTVRRHMVSLPREMVPAASTHVFFGLVLGQKLLVLI